MPPAEELVQTFPCFGSAVSIRAAGRAGSVARSLHFARAIAEEFHSRLSRFDPGSELSLLNADPRERVPAGPLMRRLAEAVHWAGEHSDGLVDATCLPAIVAAGYRGHWTPGAEWHADDAPAGPASTGTWADVHVAGEAVIRPPGTLIDSGGLGKGLAADLMARALAPCAAWAIDCGGDLRVGGRFARMRAVEVTNPEPGSPIIQRLHLSVGAVATSGTTRRRWPGGHHLIDPRTGRPAETGIVQATAVANTGLTAEVRAKAALLAGPDRAADYLPDGGVIVLSGGEVRTFGRSRGALSLA
jgi:thiamine biosynthesis lipoprotein